MKFDIISLNLQIYIYKMYNIIYDNGNMQIKKAIIPAAGFGTRFLPATKAQPKEMLPIVDKPIIQWIVEEVAAAGIKNIIFVTGKNKRSLEDHFDNQPELENALQQNGKSKLLETVQAISGLAKFSFVRQGEQRGNADAIRQTLHLLHNEPAMVMFGDEILINDDGSSPLKKQLAIFEKLQEPLLLLYPLPHEKVSSYGVVKIKKTGDENLYEVLDIVEKPKADEAPSNLTVIGRYALTPKVLSLIDTFYENDAPKAPGEIGITQILQKYIREGGKVYATEFKGRRFDCGSKIGFLKATVHYGLRHPETGPEFNDYLKEIRDI